MNLWNEMKQMNQSMAAKKTNQQSIQLHSLRMDGVDWFGLFSLWAARSQRHSIFLFLFHFFNN